MTKDEKKLIGEIVENLHDYLNGVTDGIRYLEAIYPDKVDSMSGAVFLDLEDGKQLEFCEDTLDNIVIVVFTRPTYRGENFR